MADRSANRPNERLGEPISESMPKAMSEALSQVMPQDRVSAPTKSFSASDPQTGGSAMSEGKKASKPISKTKKKAAASVAPVLTASDLKERLRTKLKTELTARLGESKTRSSLVKEAENRLCDNLIRALGEEFGIWGAFRCFGFEPNVDRAVRLLSQIKWAYPRIEGNRLDFFIPHHSEAFRENNLGILEPDPTQSDPVDLFDINGFVIPGIGFDRAGFRLGRGGGFYDRLLQVYSGMGGEPPLRIGVGFEEQILDSQIPSEPHDICLDGIVTDREVFGKYFEERDIR